MELYFKIVLNEYKTIIKGILISALIIFPFTFIPTLTKFGFSLDAFQDRIKYALLYAVGFATLVVIAAIIHNYISFKEKNVHFVKAAFVDLEFEVRLGGLGSIVSDIEIFLLGQVGDYYFRLNIITSENGKPSVEIIPLIELDEQQQLIDYLITNNNFIQDWFLGKRIILSDQQMNQSKYLTYILRDIANILKSKKVIALLYPKNK